MNVMIEVGPGELIDKITILEIKAAHISTRDKLANIRTELEILSAARDAGIPQSPALAQLTTDLKAVNESLWRIEDDIRDCERAGDFGARFIGLARAVYRTNDQRAALKRRINELLHAHIIEEKSYAKY